MRSTPSARLAGLLAIALALAGCGRGAPDSAAPHPPATPDPPGPASPASPDRKATAAAGDAAGPDTGTIRFVAGGEGAGAPRGGALAEDIARGLSTDVRVLACGQGVIDGRSAFAPDWVRVHRVDLDDDGHDDWLVEGRHPCLAGADGADWWLYAEGGTGRRLLLAADRARSVELLPSRSHGFSDVRLVRTARPDAVARSDGSVYVASTDAPG